MKYKDPHLQRETEKYKRPIPSRELIMEVMDKASTPLAFRELTQQLGLDDSQDLDAMKYRLRAMQRDGQILKNRNKQYATVKKADLIAGRISGHPDGFGFLIPDDGSDDLYLHYKQMRKVLDGDRVLCSIRGIDHKGRREGNIVEVLEHNTSELVGRFFVESGIGFVTPDNKKISQDVLIPPGNAGDAEAGQIVVVEILEQPNARHQAIGKITQTLGDHMAPGMEIDIAVRNHDLPHVWPKAVLKESMALGDSVSEEDKSGRTDYRKLPLVTIDGEDSRDFDDAVYCKPKKSGGWKLAVAIADVAHYVSIGSEMDKEAWNRGTSVYFPAEVIPMLPESISNGLCSLNPQVDRLCMVCEIHIDTDGEIKSYQFANGIMHSHARLTYSKVAAMVIDQDKSLRKKYAAQVGDLDNLYDLYKVLRKARDKRGSIDFETTETRIVFGDDRKIEKILPYERNDAHKIIEECMILANVCAARFLKKHKIPALHRVHDGPNPEKLQNARDFLATRGLVLSGGDNPQPKDFASVLTAAKTRDDAHLIQTILLRSLSRAHYAPVNTDNPASTRHFGLAQADYAHFTSPIRRYPDLLVHRAIRHILEGGSKEDYIYQANNMSELGEHTSTTEQRADEASWDVLAWLKAEYMQDKVGEKFSGIVSAVTSFGLFVELDDIYVEGLVHVTALKSDYYHFDPVLYHLKGESSGKAYGLGDKLDIIVASVNIDERKIDFVLPETLDDSRKPPRKKKKPKNKKKDKHPKKNKRTTKSKK